MLTEIISQIDFAVKYKKAYIVFRWTPLIWFLEEVEAQTHEKSSTGHAFYDIIFLFMETLIQNPGFGGVWIFKEFIEE